ncbi:MAG: TolC family protein [Acidobacteriales bacterium]|nr:TolC family protein [Terriglobales bacterium]
MEASHGQLTAGVATQSGTGAAPETITLKDALERARANSVEYRAAQTEAGLRHEDKVIARSTLLPNVNYRTEFIYTEPTQPSSAQARQDVMGGTPRFVANNAVHEYVALGNAHQDVSGALFEDYLRTSALEAVAKAKTEIARRGLVATVVNNFYELAVAQRKIANISRAVDEANRFLDISQKLERGGEVAHADVIKAQIQANDRARDGKEAELALNVARINLAVLLFKDFNLNYMIVDDLSTPESLPTRDEVVAAGQKNNPDLAAAFHALRAAGYELVSAKFDYLPSLSFDYNYGLDATHFALRTDGLRNVGYSASAQLNLPVWNWFATSARVKQAGLNRDQAQVELNAAQKKLIGDLQTRYDEAVASQQELELLRQSAQLAADSLRLTTMRYQAGESTVLEVVDAQNTLTTARNALDDGELRYRVALAGIQTLTGNWNP